MSVFIPDFKKALNKNFYKRDTETVARDLIGKILIRKLGNGDTLTARIIETEAYLSEGDLASHSANGKSKRNAAMFEEGGIIYIYKIYGIHHCVNIVTGTAGKGCAVLLRGLEPLSGIETMLRLRETNQIKSLCKGPGNVAKAFGFKPEDNFKSIIGENLFVQETENNIPEIICTKRIGITKSPEHLLRFIIKN